MPKTDPLTLFARGLSPDAAERLGLGLAKGIAVLLPEITSLLARELNRKTIPVREVWEMAGMGESRFYKLVREGRGPRTIREGAHHVVLIEDVEVWLQELATTTPSRRTKQHRGELRSSRAGTAS